MTSFSTGCPEIDNLRVRPINSTPIKVVKMVNFHGWTVAVDAKGTVFTNAVPKNALYWGLSDRGRLVVKALIHMKVLSAAATTAYIKILDEREREEQRHHHTTNLIINADTLGIKLTVAQRKKLHLTKKVV